MLPKKSDDGPEKLGDSISIRVRPALADIKNSNCLKTADWGCGNYSLHLEDFALLMEMDVEKVLANAAYLNTKEE
ncbi:hypothetical protein [Faecalicatena contorta]|uniref:Uncharacterized protein n=1 Tax=Faecalicatena contorta TaxID=39482 RepID=A0A316AMR7_9FIRM|nr:hypothetical protein [Faecalicatena contorta]PWJ51317.1 hypothetical protein A8805_10288 [Faecalicatena contorta]SUQ12873.1 hypothetical protein SAMN05216529_10288 [Faecalicatena contorta]